MHKHDMALADDGTLDTVIVCSVCGQEYRYNADELWETPYDEFIAWAIEDATGVHESDLELDPES